MVNPISETQLNLKMKIAPILSAFSTILCLLGAEFFILSIRELRGKMWGFASMYAIVFSIFIIIGALSGLKYQLGGRLLCFIIGIISLFTYLYIYQFYFSFKISCKFPIIFLLGTFHLIFQINSYLSNIGFFKYNNRKTDY